MLVVIAWAVLALIWGSTWLVSRIGLQHLPPLSFAGIRFLLASALLFAFVHLQGRARRPFTRADRLLVLRTGLVAFAATYALMFWGMQHVSAGLSAVMFSTLPLFTMLYAHREVAGEGVTWRALGGGLLGLAGVALILSDQLHAGETMVALGCVAVLTSAACMARAQVTVKASGSHLEPTRLAAWQLLVGATALLAVGAAVEGNPFALTWNPPAVWSLLYLALIATSLAWYLYYWLLRRVRVTTMSTITLVQPLIAIVLGRIVLGEPMGRSMLVGTAATLGGISLIMRPSTSRPQPARAAAPGKAFTA